MSRICSKALEVAIDKIEGEKAKLENRKIELEGMTALIERLKNGKDDELKSL